MKTLLQINPVVRTNTSTGRIIQEIGDLAIEHGWNSYIAYSYGRDGYKPCHSKLVPVGNMWSVAVHGVMTRLFDRHGLASEKATTDFIHEIIRIKPDIIHIHNIHGYFLNYKRLFEFLAETDIKVVWTVHDCWLYTGHCYSYSYVKCDKWKTGCGNCPQKKLFPASWFVDRSAQNWLDKQAAFTSLGRNQLTIVPVSDWMRNEMRESFLKDYNFEVIHNGIDTDVFKCYETEQIRQKYHLADKHVLLGVASIWSREKGLDDFIALAERLNDSEVIVLVGVTEKQARKLPDTIIPVRRTENIRQLAELYSAADVFVNTTWQDNYPTVNMEAISCGTPIITYRTGGSVETVTEYTGAIVEQGDIDGLVSAIRKIEQLDREKLRRACRSYAEANFKKRDRYIDYMYLYDQITRI